MITIKKLFFLKKIIHTISVWVARKWLWAMENKLFWWSCLFSVGTVGFVFFWRAPGQSDFRIRTLGMTFQLIGVMTVWMDLKDTTTLFGKKGILLSNWDWLKRGILGHSSIIMAGGCAEASAAVSGRATIRRPILPGLSELERIETLEENAAHVDADVHALFGESEKTRHELTLAISAESSNRQTAHEKLRLEIEGISTGNASLLLFGLVWLGVGVTLSTWAPEIAKIVSCHWAEVVKTI